MHGHLTLKNIALRFIDRIANPNFENKAVGAFLLSGFAFAYLSQPFSLEGRIKLNLGFIDADLGVGNDPNWFLFSIGLLFIVYGGYALYKLKLFPSSSRRSAIGELLLLIEQNKSSMRNAQIQQYFLDLFKIKASVPIIEHLLAVDDPIGRIYDYRYGGHFVVLTANQFVPADRSRNHNRHIRAFSWAYYVLSGIAVICMAAPLAPFFDHSTKLQLSAVGLPAAIVLGLIAALLLNPIRAHSAALRLLATPPGETVERTRDAETLLELLKEIHTPTFDSFIHFGRLDCIYGDILHYWEGFNAKVLASRFHIYDTKLRDIVIGLHQAWGKSVSLGQYFRETNSPSLHKFDSRYDIYSDPNARVAYEAFGNAIVTADSKFRELLSIVREEFPTIDIDSTNAAAMEDFRKYQLSAI